MRHLPTVHEPIEPLNRMLYGGISSKLLLVAIELEAFSLLSRPTTALSAAEALQTDPRNTRLFLDALVANELITKEDGAYQNTPLADAFLVKNKDTYLGDVLLDNAEWMHYAFEDMAGLVRHGPPAGGRSAHSISWAEEARIRANYQRAGLAQWVAAMTSRLVEFPDMGRMLDLGSGAGLIGLAIVARHPTMTGVLFDRPEVIQVARQFIREYEIADRVTTIGGDYVSDSIGDGYDLVWTSYTLCRETLDATLRKVHAALKPGGVFINLGEGLSQERTRPKGFINAMLSVNLTSKHEMLDEGEMAQQILKVGFRSVHSRVVAEAQPHGPAVLDIARR